MTVAGLFLWVFTASSPWMTSQHASVDTSELRPDSVLVFRPLARFQSPSAVTFDPNGTVLVSDVRLAAVLRVNLKGETVEAIGGPGSDAARFDNPLGVDASTGLVLSVADAENGRIQRFSADGRFLELIPVSSDPEAPAPDPQYLERDVRLTGTADGRVADVVTTGDGRLYAIETVSGTVRSWDRERRPLAPLGAAVGDVMPVRPVALATDGSTVYVADPGLPGIVVIDRFGRPARALGRGVSDGVRSVAVETDCVWALLPDRLAVFTPEGVLRATYRTDIAERTVDLAAGDGRLYVLGTTTLFVTRSPCSRT